MRCVVMLLMLASILGCAQQPETRQAIASTKSRPTGLDLQAALAASLPHDASLPSPDSDQQFQRKLTAQGSNWTVTVQWNPGDLHRFVTWHEDDQGFSLGIPLRTRGKPFELAWGGVTMTRYGPYQPACVHQRDGSDWHVQMSHEQADFPSEEDLTKMLSRSIPGRPHAHPALSSDGTMVTLRSPLFSGGDTLDVQIWMLTVDGKKPSPEVLEPFLTGKITEEPNQTMEGTK